MDKIWYRNPLKSEVIGRCGGDEKNWMTKQNGHSRMLKIFLKNKTLFYMREVFLSVSHSF